MNFASRLGVASGTLAFVLITIACAGKGSPKTANPAITPPQGTETSQGASQKTGIAEATDKAEARAKAKEQAEKEAEAKNEANRVAYEAEVTRLKQEYEVALEKFNSKKAKFDKSFQEYQRSKIEFEAARKMLQARSFYDDSNDNSAKRPQQERDNLMAIARGRFKEIISLYPDSETAKDAKTLLDGGTVKNKKLPAQPVPPVAPPRLNPLNLPAPPTPVAPNYPVDLPAAAPVNQLLPKVSARLSQFKQSKDPESGFYDFDFNLSIVNNDTKDATVFCLVYGKNDTVYPPARMTWPGLAIPLFDVGKLRSGSDLLPSDITRNWKKESQWCKKVTLKAGETSEAFDSGFTLSKEAQNVMPGHSWYNEVSVWLFLDDGRLVYERTTNVTVK